MPRSAAVMLGLALVALSIGFNTVRYPAVWEMVNSSGVSKPTEPTSIVDSSQCSATMAATQPSAAVSEPPKPIDVTPSPQVIELSAGDSPSAPAENDGSAAIQSTAQRSLVPVVPVALSGTPYGDAAESNIHRLPPVTPDCSAANIAQLIGGSIPVYPTTGIE